MSGTVTDLRGRRLNDVAISVDEFTAEGEYRGTESTRTDENGEYWVSGITQDAVVVTASRFGHEDHEAQLDLSGDSVTPRTHDIKLVPLPNVMDLLIELALVDSSKVPTVMVTIRSSADEDTRVFQSFGQRKMAEFMTTTGTCRIPFYNVPIEDYVVRIDPIPAWFVRPNEAIVRPGSPSALFVCENGEQLVDLSLQLPSSPNAAQSRCRSFIEALDPKALSVKSGWEASGQCIGTVRFLSVPANCEVLWSYCGGTGEYEFGSCFPDAIVPDKAGDRIVQVKPIQGWGCRFHVLARAGGSYEGKADCEAVVDGRRGFLADPNGFIHVRLDAVPRHVLVQETQSKRLIKGFDVDPSSEPMPWWESQRVIVIDQH